MRRTKEEAARTREDILDAALVCFNRHGLSRTTLDHIAGEARVTRGAVYWHFKGKSEILAALRERVSLPFLDRADTELLKGAQRAPLDRVEHFLQEVFEDLQREPLKQEALGLMHFRCEFVDGLQDELQSMMENLRALTRAFEKAYRDAQDAGELRKGVSPRLAAMETSIFVSGLVRLWLLDPAPGGFRKSAPDLIRAHVAAKRA